MAELLSPKTDGRRYGLNYRPISYDEVQIEMERHGIGVVDGHEARKDEDDD